MPVECLAGLAICCAQYAFAVCHVLLCTLSTTFCFPMSNAQRGGTSVVSSVETNADTTYPQWPDGLIICCGQYALADCHLLLWTYLSSIMHKDER